MQSKTAFFLFAVFGAFVVAKPCWAQQAADSSTPPWYVAIRYGYFNPSNEGSGGILSVALGRRLGTDYTAEFSFGSSAIETEYQEPFFSGKSYIEHFQLFRLTFDRALLRQGSHHLRAGIGILYERETLSRAGFTLVSEGNELVVRPVISQYTTAEAGLLLRGAYRYQAERFFVGVQADVHLYYALGYGGLVVTPTFGVRF